MPARPTAPQESLVSDRRLVLLGDDQNGVTLHRDRRGAVVDPRDEDALEVPPLPPRTPT